MSLRREKDVLKKTLECDLDNKQLELTNFVRKKDAELNELKVSNEMMLEKNAAKVANLHKEKTKESLLLKEARMSIKKLEDELRGANNVLVEEKRWTKVETDCYLTKLSSKVEEIAKLSGKNEKLKNDFEKKELELQRLETLIKGKEEEILQKHNKKEELAENVR